MYMCVHIHVPVSIHVCMYIHTHVHVFVHIYVHVLCAHVYMYVHVCIGCACVYIHLGVSACMSVYMHACVYVWVCRHVCVHMHTCSHEHKHMCVSLEPAAPTCDSDVRSCFLSVCQACTKAVFPARYHRPTRALPHRICAHRKPQLRGPLSWDWAGTGSGRPLAVQELAAFRALVIG